MENPMDYIKDMRRRVVAGEEVTDEELKEAIQLLHNFRNKVEPKAGAASVKKAAKAKATKDADVDLSDLL